MDGCGGDRILEMKYIYRREDHEDDMSMWGVGATIVYSFIPLRVYPTLVPLFKDMKTQCHFLFCGHVYT